MSVVSLMQNILAYDKKEKEQRGLTLLKKICDPDLKVSCQRVRRHVHLNKETRKHLLSATVPTKYKIICIYSHISTITYTCKILVKILNFIDTSHDF